MNIPERTPTPIERLQSALSDEMGQVDDLIRDRMRSESTPRIPQVTAHLLDAGGKRIRPLLTLAAANLCGYAGGHHVHLAAAVEFIHTATLLHDDVVDESSKRRGRPTANLLWDNKSSVLVGDYLFARAFKLMVETKSIRVLDILSNASAVIAEGEVLQMTAASNLATDQETYLRIIRGKTAALFAAATESGAVLANAPDDHIDALEAYGDALGISFQLTDDLLDYGGLTTALGKNVGDDFREGKMSLPVIHAVDASDADETAFWERVITQNKQTDGDLEQAQAIMVKHGSLLATRAEALAYSKKARAALDPLPASELRYLLEELTGFVVARIV